MECISHLFSGSLSGSPSGSIRLGLGWGSDPHRTPVDLLLLGTGWTGSFLLPIAADAGLSTASTTRDGRNGTIPFAFDPESDDLQQYDHLPDAKTVVIIFPFYRGEDAVKLVRSYEKTRNEGADQPKFILLGSTGIYNDGPTLQAKIMMDSPTAEAPPMEELSKKHKKHKKVPSKHPSSSPWIDRNSPYNKDNSRASAEDAFLSLAKDSDSPARVSVLCLSGLWGHGRSPRRFIGMLASSKEALRGLGSVPFVHGRDVARAILAMHNRWEKADGDRWILTNERLYDLWDLAAQWGNAGEAGRDHPPRGPQPQWVQELVRESQERHLEKSQALLKGLLDSSEEEDELLSYAGPIRALPRSIAQIGTGLDSSEFWSTFGITPDVPWVD